MNVSRLQKRKAYLALGAGGVAMSAGYLGMSVQLPFGELARPGASLFPIAVGVILAFASLSTVWEGWRMPAAEQVEFPARQDARRLLVLLGALFVYIVALPWLGQIIASSLFLIMLMRVLSDVGWPRVIAYSLAISGTLYAVFVRLLNVPMPRGLLDF
ncbi:MAG: tripartite tricarboxylate transporter TctB family protein [Rhodospirillales bacterium]|jgi:putative tricarboxylic transport membrane protein